MTPWLRITSKMSWAVGWDATYVGRGYIVIDVTVTGCGWGNEGHVSPTQ